MPEPMKLPGRSEGRGRAQDGARDTTPGPARPSSPGGLESRQGTTAAPSPVEGPDDGAAPRRGAESHEAGTGQRQTTKYSPRHAVVPEVRVPGRLRRALGWPS
jgi:hypothetical protein